MSNCQIPSRLESFQAAFEEYHSIVGSESHEMIIHQLVTCYLAETGIYNLEHADTLSPKREVELLVRSVWDSNRIAWLRFGSPSPREALESHGEEVLEIAGETSDLASRLLFKRATKEDLVLALATLESNDSLKTLIHLEEFSDTLWQTGVFAGALLLALVAAVWFFWQKANVSEDFKILAAHRDSKWAKALCEVGSSHRTFRIPDAWYSMKMLEEDRKQAISELASVEGFSELVPHTGSEFDEPTMYSSEIDRSEYVYKCIRPGLRFRDRILERALVDTCTSDYVAIRLVSANPVTSVFLGGSGDAGQLPPTYSISPGPLQNLYLREVDDDDLQSWLAELVEKCPSGELSQVDVKPGTKYNERMMLNIGEEVADLAQARVQKVLHKGLLRSGEVLLRARIIASEPKGNRYGDI